MVSGAREGRSRDVEEAELVARCTQSHSVPITLFHVRDALQVKACDINLWVVVFY